MNAKTVCMYVCVSDSHFSGRPFEIIIKRSITATYYTYIGPTCCQIEMYTGRVACCPLVSHSEYADRTDRRTPDRYVRRGQHKNMREREVCDTDDK